MTLSKHKKNIITKKMRKDVEMAKERAVQEAHRGVIFGLGEIDEGEL